MRWAPLPGCFSSDWLMAVPRRQLARVTALIALAVCAVAPAGARAASISATEVSSMGSLSAVACTGATDCYAVGLDLNGNAAVLHIANGTPGTVTAFPDVNFEPLGLACSPGAACLAVGNTVDSASGTQVGAVAPVTAGSPGQSTEVPGAESLSVIGCAASLCVAAGQDQSGAPGTTTITSGNPQAFADFANGQFSPQAVGCPSASTCVVAGQDATPAPPAGALSAVVAAGPGPVRDTTASTQLSGIACTTAGACIAGGYLDTGSDGSGNPLSEPVITTVSGGQAKASFDYPALSDGAIGAVACATGPTCLAVGTDGNGNAIGAPVLDGAAGVAQTYQTDPSIGQLQLTGLACPSASTCLAVGQDAAFNPIVAEIPVPAFQPLSSGGSGGSGSPGGPTSPGHRHRPLTQIPTRLLTAIAWRRPVRRLNVTVRCQTATTLVGIEGLRVRLQERPRGSHRAWRVVRSARTRRIGAVRGEVRFIVPAPSGAGTEYRAVMAGTRRYRASVSSVKTFFILVTTRR
ncbi:MAG: hypothetical protein WBQ18_09295 [Solirubrobacteraceae bacterium]